jgi:hypothetical protein
MTSFNHRLAFGSILVVVAGMLLYGFGAGAAGDPTARFFIPAVVVAILIAGAIRRSKKALWVPALGGVPVLSVFVVDPFRLLHPDSFFDFWPSLLMLAGTTTAFVASVLALRSDGSTFPFERHVVVVGVIALVASGIFSGYQTFFGPTSTTGTASVTAAEDRWDPATIEVDAMRPVAIVVRNPDWFAHTFVIDTLDVDIYIAPNRERMIEIEAPPGAYRYECDVTGHAGMVGTLVATGG